MNISGDRKFLTIAPVNEFLPDSSGNVTLSITGDYLTNLSRTGLLFTGGSVGGTLSSTFTFSVQAGQITSATFPIAVPSAPGNPAGVWEMYRLAAPHPTILPSYDQIGFDSLHFLIGIVSAITGADTAVINPPRGVTGRRQR